MRLTILIEQLSSTGGMELAALRLAHALSESGAEVHVLHGGPDQAALAGDLRTTTVAGLADPTAEKSVEEELRAALRRLDADVCLVASGRLWLLTAALNALPRVVHLAMEWSPVCAAGSRYRSRDEAVCTINAGWKCVAARAEAHCVPRRSLADLGPVRRQRRMARLSEKVTTWVPSAEMHRMFVADGASPDRLAVVPNLGMRVPQQQLEDLAQSATGAASAYHYLGRLTHTKGVLHLPAVDDALDGRLVLHGDGYLLEDLRPHFGSRLQPLVPQDTVAGVLMQTRGIVFPSLWPEPGGIVGLDAQIFGAPVAAYNRGAARDWVAAHLVAPSDAHALGTALRNTDRPEADAGVIAGRMKAYWAAVGEIAYSAAALAADGRSAASLPSDAVSRCLLSSGVKPLVTA